MSIKKKFLGMLASLALVVGLMPIAAFAADDASLTVTADEGNRKLQLFQVFTGDYNATLNNLSNIEWGSSIADPTKFVNTYLKGKGVDAILDTTFGALTTTSAADVAEKLKDAEDDRELAIAFSKAVGNYLGANPTPVKELSSGKKLVTTQNVKYEYTFDNLKHGYYLVKDATDAKILPENGANSRFIVRVVGATELKLKLSSPTLTKKITRVDNSAGEARTGKPEKDNASSVGIGDTVHFSLASAVPDVTGYNQYQFMIEDTLSTGLSFAATIADDVVVKMGNDTLTKNTHYKVDVAGQKVQIYFLGCLTQFKDKAGTPITVTYTATVNDSARVGKAGENNTAHLVYSNNPESTGTGQDKPGKDDVTGTTPDQKTYVYTTQIKITKTDKNGNPLQGAEFKLTGTNLLTKSLIVKNTYTADDAGTYYKLIADGTYTTVAPQTGTEDKYEKKAGTNDYQKYTAAVTTTPESQTATDNAVTATVDEGGFVTFQGLLPGNYTLEETKAPDGYNKLANPITFTVEWSGPTGTSTDCTWSITQPSQPITTEGDGTFTLTIQNSLGSSLPSTGSIGTVLFYIVGGVLMVGALVVLITKKRLAHKQ